MSSPNWVLQYYKKSCPQTTQSSTHSISSNLNNNNQNLLNLLFNHKIIIENLLENQNYLKKKVQKLINIQSHAQSLNLQNNLIIPNFFHKNQKINQIQKIDNITNLNIYNNKNKQKQKQLNHHNNKIKQKQTLYIVKPIHKKNIIEIVSTCPDVQNQSNSSQYINRNNHNKQYHQYNKMMINQNYIVSSNNQNINCQNNDENDEKPSKGCQTKNVIKNYGKSILTFIKKNRQLVSKISKQLGFNEKELFQEFQKFKGNVNSISELKVFWTETGNPFAKIFRIISNLYLKKHSIKHTFNSRVKNYALHIKYRKRLLDILKNPEDFTNLKCF